MSTQGETLAPFKFTFRWRSCLWENVLSGRSRESRQEFAGEVGTGLKELIGVGVIGEDFSPMVPNLSNAATL